MTPTEYKKARAGLRLRTLRPLRNGWGTIPTGTLVTVTFKRGGFTVQGDPCECCGVRVSMTHVDASEVAIAGPEDEAPTGFVDVLFGGPPSAESGRFIETDLADGSSCSVGEWIERSDGLWALRITRESLHRAVTS